MIHKALDFSFPILESLELHGRYKHYPDWDNNGGEDFRIVLGPAPAARGTAGAGPLAMAIAIACQGSRASLRAPVPAPVPDWPYHALPP